MDRETLENCTINELRELASIYKIDTKGSRPSLFDRILQHFGIHGWPENWPLSKTNKETTESGTATAAGPSGVELNTASGSGTPLHPETTSQGTETVSNGAVANIDVNEIIQSVVRILSERQNSSRSPATTNSARAIESPISPTHTDQSMTNGNWHQVKCASKLLPTFAGKDDENVVRWLDRISSVARMYQFADHVVLLASVSQLKGRASDWYNRQPIESVSSWEEFKFRIRRYFERKESYTATLARINSRIWKSHSEKFVEYAEAKLNLMQFLSLSEKEKIELLADGVKDFAIRRLVLNTWIDNVPDFIEHVRKITEDSIITRKVDPSKFPSKRANEKANTTEEKLCFTCKKPGHLSQDCQVAKATCFRCGQTGHLSTMCPRREVNRASVNHVEEQEEQEEPEGQEEQESEMPSDDALPFQEDILQIGQLRIGNNTRPCITVARLCNNIKIRALVDTGSPVNLIKKSAYENFFNNRELLRVSKEISYKGINESPVLIYGKIYDQIVLGNEINSWYDIALLVVDDTTMRYDMIIGREFLNNSNLKLIYYDGHFSFESANKFEKNALADILTINAVEIKDKYDVIWENTDVDLELQERQELLNVFKEVDEMQVEKINDGYSVAVYLKDHSLFRYAPRRMSMAEKIKLQEIIDDLLQRNIIRPSISPYCSRVVLVTRRSGKARMCIDLRPLNQRIHPQKYPFPIIEDHLDKLHGKKIFTKLDLKDGFHQISIHPDHTKYFSFATPSGQYEFIRMPFGYSEAPAEFQKWILQIFDSFTRAGKILIYIDDILIPTVTIRENLMILKEILICLKKYGLELNLAKCIFLQREIEYLGYMVSENGISMCKRHIQAILDFPQPKNVREIRSFLGLTNYFRKFVKDYALKTRSLQTLVKKDKDFLFDESCKEAFIQLKKELTSPPVLCIYNPTADTELHTDASSRGFGAILFQKQANGYLAPIGYFSKATTDVERNYHSYELETLAIVRAIERFHVYLQGIKFRIVTDCNSLVLAMKKININPRIARWSLILQHYQFELIHRASNRMSHVDCLSRSIMTINLLTAEDEIMYKQLTDPKIRKIAEDLEANDHKYFVLIEGLVFRKYRDKNLFVVPENMVYSVIRIYHDDMGHVGVDKTIHGILGHYWFPCLKLSVKQYIENCIKCLSCSLVGGKPEGEMEIYEKVALPFHTLHLDHFGPLESTLDNYKYILAVIDAFTKFVWLFPTKSTTAEEAIRYLTDLFDLFGLPKRIISDRGTSFTSKSFAEFLNNNKIKHSMTAVASPWANGQIERVNRFLKSTLSKLIDAPEDWKNVIGKAKFVINNTFNKSINTTPSKILLGYDQRQNSTSELQALIERLTEVDIDIERERADARDSAKIVNRELQEYNKKAYDRRHKKPTKYKKGDLVLVKILQQKPGINQKLLPKYKGPYQIKAVLKKNRFVVTDVPGYNLTQKPLNTILSSDKIKPWIRVPEKIESDGEVKSDKE